jgi:proline dehydrogenase
MFNKFIAAMLPYMPEKLVWIFSKRYIAGENIEDAIRVSKELNERGMLVTLDILGEFIKTLSEAEQNKNDYLGLIERTQQEGINGNYSVKPSMFGLLLDKEQCYQHIRTIVEKAASYNNFIRVDMEDSDCTADTIAIYRRLKVEFPKNCGLVVQAYMKRTMKDLNDLMDIHSQENPLNYRLCKGIYVEPADIAYKKYEVVNEHFLADLEYMFQQGIYAAIATHDKPLVDGAYKLIEKYNIPNEKYEFQMLYGVTPELRQSIVDAGHRLRVYVPYGKQWFGYSTRRLKENPKMAWLIIKALFVRG